MKKITLRPFQREAVQAALNSRKSTIKAATGTGKTIVAIEWLKAVPHPSLIVVPTQALIFQTWGPKLRDAGLLDTGEFYAYSKLEGDPIITTYASVLSHPYLVENANAIILDEIHHLGARTPLLRVLPLLKSKEYVLGLSSVPERRDETHELFLKEFPICFDLSLGEAIRSGIVAPLEIVRLPVEMSEKEREIYVKQTAAIQRAFEVCGSNIARWNRCFDPRTRQYVGRIGMLAMSRRKKLLSTIEAKKDQILRVISNHPNELIIAFSESVPAIEEVRDYLLENGISCETYHSKTEPWKRMEILEDWGRKYKVLLSCRALEEGIDVKEVAVGVLIASGSSKRQFIQRMGRIIRPMEGKIARFYVVYSRGTTEESYIKTIDGILNT